MIFLCVFCCNGGFCGVGFCARRKTAVFNRIFLDNFDNGGYTGSAFRVSKESAKYTENRNFSQIYNQVRAFGISLIGWFCVNKK